MLICAKDCYEKKYGSKCLRACVWREEMAGVLTNLMHIEAIVCSGFGG